MEAEPSSATSPAMSLGARLLNVFAAPGEVFEAVKAAPFSVANWLVPAGLVALAGVIYILVVFGNPVLIQQVRNMQDAEIQKSVDAGKMSQAQADQAKQVMGGIGMTIARVGGAVAVTAGAVIAPLWWGFVAWLVARFVFRAPMGFMRGVEIAGLSSLVGILGLIVTLFLALGLGTIFAAPSPALFFKEFDMANRGHLALGALNVFSLWQMALVALGLSKLIDRSFGAVAIVVFGVWVGFKGCAIILGIAQLAL